MVSRLKPPAASIAVAVIIIASAILILVVMSYIGVGSERQGSLGEREERKRIIVYSLTWDDGLQTSVPDFAYLNFREMEHSRSTLFLDPFGKTMLKFRPPVGSVAGDPDSSMDLQQKLALLKDVDPYEKYLLIRLPQWLGGERNNVTSFRAYSILDPESRCMLGYRENAFGHGGGYIIDPCHSNIFRVYDGYQCYGRIAVGANPTVSSYNALPRMKLALDSDGYITAFEPDGSATGDGIVGEGRISSGEEISAIDKVDVSCDAVRGR